MSNTTLFFVLFGVASFTNCLRLAVEAIDAPRKRRN